MTTPHHVAPDDEGRHDPDADDLWGESYYCDFVDDGQCLRGLAAARPLPQPPGRLVDHVDRPPRARRRVLG